MHFVSESKEFKMNNILEKWPTVRTYPRTALIALCVSGSALLLAWMFYYSTRGLVFTDEGFYINSIVNPSIYSHNHTFFGFFYHPLYTLLDGNLEYLRYATIAITFLLAFTLAYLLTGSLAPAISNDQLARLAAASGLATSALTQFDSWLITPSYNTLALQALSLTAIGLLLADNKPTLPSIIGWVLVGLGGWMAFMAKFSTALALAVCVPLYLLAARKVALRLMTLAGIVAASLLLITAFAIDGSITGFIARIQKAVDFGRILGSGHTLTAIFRIDTFQIWHRNTILMGFFVLAISVSVLGVASSRLIWQRVGLLAALGLVLVTIATTLAGMHLRGGFGPYQGTGFLCFALALMLVWIAIRSSVRNNSLSRQDIAIALLFMLFPHIYAFGTNSNYWLAGGGAAVFWMLSGIVLLGPLLRDRLSLVPLLPVAMAAQSFTAVLLQSGFNSPYRQPSPVQFHQTAVTFGAKPSSLLMPKDYAGYVTRAITAARTSGLSAGTPVIDLTGLSPSLLYAMGAESLGQAWNVGGYPGSLDMAKLALSEVPCDTIATAWVLYEPDGPRSIPTTLMASVGASFPDAYRRMATFHTAPGAGGYTAPRLQELYMPLLSTELSRQCNAVRSETRSGASIRR